LDISVCPSGDVLPNGFSRQSISSDKASSLRLHGESTVTGQNMGKPEGGLRTRGILKKSRPGVPLVTIITVVLNAEKYLEDSIISVLSQKYDNVEYILLDGGSTDSTLDIIKKYDEKIDYWASEKDNGIYDALNKAVKLAGGDWLYVLGADDVMLNVLHRIALLLTDKATIYYGDVYLPGRHEIIRGKFTRYRLMYTPMTHQGIFYPKEVFADYSYNVKYPYAADYELEMRCFNDSRYTFVYLPVLVAIYNDSDGKSANNEDSSFSQDRKSIIRDNFPGRYYFIFCLRHYVMALLQVIGVKGLLRKVKESFLS